MGDDFSDIPITRPTTARGPSYRRRPSRTPMILLIVALHAIPITVFLLFLGGVFKFGRTPAAAEHPASAEAPKVAPVVLPHAKQGPRVPEPVPDPKPALPPTRPVPAPVVAAPRPGTDAKANVPPPAPSPGPAKSTHLPRWTVMAGTQALRTVAVAASGRAVTGGLDRTVRVFEPDGTETQVFPDSVSPLGNVAISHDGDTVLLSGNPAAQVGRLGVGKDCLLRAVSVKTRKTSVVGVQATVIYCVGLSANGRFAMTGTERLVRYWDVSTRRELRPGGFAGHTGVPRGLDFHPKLAQAVSAANDGTARIWDLKKGEAIRVINDLSPEVTAVSYSPDGRMILVSGVGAFGVWDAVTGAPLLGPTGRPHLAASTAACWTPDGQIIVAGPSFVSRIDPADGRQLHRFDSPPPQILSVAVSGDGRFLFAAGRGLACWEMTSPAAEPR
jgi:hypothetical protein